MFDGIDSIADIDPPEAEISMSHEGAMGWESGYAAGYWAAVAAFRAAQAERPVMVGKCQFHAERTWYHAEGARCDCPCHTNRVTPTHHD
jgi:hypothetical protein